MKRYYFNAHKDTSIFDILMIWFSQLTKKSLKLFMKKSRRPRSKDSHPLFLYLKIKHANLINHLHNV